MRAGRYPLCVCDRACTDVTSAPRGAMGNDVASAQPGISCHTPDGPVCRTARTHAQLFAAADGHAQTSETWQRLQFLITRHKSAIF